MEKEAWKKKLLYQLSYEGSKVNCEFIFSCERSKWCNVYEMINIWTADVYLTIILWARVGYEVVNISRRVGYNDSYPTSANRIIVLLNSSLSLNRLDILVWCKRSDSMRRRENLWRGVHFLSWMKHTTKASERVFFPRFSSIISSKVVYISWKLWQQLRFTGWSDGKSFSGNYTSCASRTKEVFTLYL